jgi:hypothetical protein
VASKAPAWLRVSPEVLEAARALVEYAEGGRADPPNLSGVKWEELYLALRALGRNPLEVARRARERWEALRRVPEEVLRAIPEWADGLYITRLGEGWPVVRGAAPGVFLRGRRWKVRYRAGPEGMAWLAKVGAPVVVLRGGAVLRVAGEEPAPTPGYIAVRVRSA